MMKKSILVLSDLSDNAAHAAITAAQFACQLNLDLILLHCDTMTSVIADEWRARQNDSLVLLAEALKKWHRDMCPKKNKPHIEIALRNGDLHHNVKAMLEHQSVEMIAIGAKLGTPAEHFFFGSDTKTLVDKSPVPVLIVPRSVPVRTIIQINFATNFLPQDHAALQYLAKLRKRLGAHLEIVHIKEYGESAGMNKSEVQQYIFKMCKSSPMLIRYNEVYGKSLVSRLNRYCKENNADVLVLSHQHHSLLFRTVREGTTDKLLSNQKFPLLVIPELPIHQEKEDEPSGFLTNIVF